MVCYSLDRMNSDRHLSTVQITLPTLPNDIAENDRRLKALETVVHDTLHALSFALKQFPSDSSPVSYNREQGHPGIPH